VISIPFAAMHSSAVFSNDNNNDININQVHTSAHGPQTPGVYLNNSIAYIIHCKTENTIFVNEKASITKTKQITIKHN